MSKNSLHQLFENVTNVHKKDLKELASGHLNENKLWKEKKEVSTKLWDGAQKPPVWLRKRIDVKNHPIYTNQLPPVDVKVNTMHDAFTDFIRGPTAYNAQPIKKEKTKKKRRKILSSNETVLPAKPEPTVLPQKNLSLPKECLPAYHLLPTKREQYKEIKHTQKDLFSEDSMHKNGKKTVAEIEKNLKLRLMELQKTRNIDGPNFFKLNVYSDVWDDLCETSQTYGSMLKSVKSDYDAYVNSLLDTHMTSNRPLEEHIHLLSLQNKEESSIKDDEEEVKYLEEQITKELEENERLRKALKDTSKKESTLSVLKKSDGSVGDDTSSENISVRQPDDLETRVEMLHAKIELQLDKLDQMKKDQQENYVPTAVCERLEHCIKETEVDIQKLLKQNDFLEHNIEELTEELENVLIKTGIKEKDARALWKRVDTSIVNYADKL